MTCHRGIRAAIPSTLRLGADYFGDAPALQAAIGTAVGQAIGSLFGDNPVGVIVGKVVGATATLVITVVSGIAKLLNGFGITLPGSAAADSYLLGAGTGAGGLTAGRGLLRQIEGVRLGGYRPFAQRV
ncbi:MAG: hypothetical protein O2892_18395 [Actinomycetota bacterium]|nr:hypothetical protein [Actinomycetota bacterium]MDA2950975.1 hypothetical protein [Actinomycetota bacterium]